MKVTVFISTCLLLALLSLSSCQDKGDPFALSTEEALALALSSDYKVSPGEGAKLIGSGDYTFVDIRPASEYAKGHLDGALNIPLQNLLDKESREFFSQNGKTIVVYGKDEAEANGPWMLLRQLGYENVKLLEGGYQYQQAPDSVQYLPPEQPHYDFAAIMARAIEEDRKEEEATRPKPAPQPVVQAPKEIIPQKKDKPKVVEEEEGC